MSVGKQTGKASISFTDPVYIQSAASVVGSKEGSGPLKEYFDMICEDSMFGEKTWESAESTMQKEAATLAIGKAGLTPRDIRMVFAGDLLAQTIASSFGIAEMGIPFYGLYGACSTMGESLISRSDRCICRLWGTYPLCHFQSLCNCRKRISFSTWLWFPAPALCHLDRYRKRCLRNWRKSPPLPVVLFPVRLRSPTQTGMQPLPA